MRFKTFFFFNSQSHLDAGYNGEAALEYSTEQSGPTSADISDSDTGNVGFAVFNVV